MSGRLDYQTRLKGEYKDLNTAIAAGNLSGFKKVMEANKEWNLNYEKQDLHEFQVAFFIDFVEGRLAAMTTTATAKNTAIFTISSGVKVAASSSRC